MIDRSEVVGAVGFIAILAFFLFLASALSGCEHGALIPIDPCDAYVDGECPSCVELVTDECVPEVVEEFCETCDPQAGYNDGYGEGFRVCSELCEANREVCEECDPLAGYDQGFIDGLAAAGIICDYTIPEGHRPKVCPDSRGDDD